MTEDSKMPAKAKTEAELLKAAKGQGHWVDLGILALFLFSPLALRWLSESGSGPDFSVQAGNFLLCAVIVFHFRTKHRMDSLIELLERKELPRPE
ncbi:MAG: hypothetical protein AAB339_01335 [Elusimicrobiota bacterium]